MVYIVNVIKSSNTSNIYENVIKIKNFNVNSSYAKKGKVQSYSKCQMGLGMKSDV